MLGEIYIQSAWQAVEGGRLGEAETLFQLALGETAEDELAVESELGLAHCALHQGQGERAYHYLEACQDRLSRHQPRNLEAVGERLAAMLEGFSAHQDLIGFRLSLLALQLLPEPPARYRQRDWEACLQSGQAGESQLEEAALAIRFGFTGWEMARVRQVLLALLPYRRQWGQIRALHNLVELVRIQAQRLSAPAAVGFLVDFAGHFLTQGLPAQADSLWLEVLKKGGVGAARTTRYLRRRQERTSLSSTRQALLAGLRSLPRAQVARVGSDWVRFWIRPGSGRPSLYGWALPLVVELQDQAGLQEVARQAVAAQDWDSAIVAYQKWDRRDETEAELQLGLRIAARISPAEECWWLERLVWFLDHAARSEEALGWRRRLARRQDSCERTAREILRQLSATGREQSWPSVEAWTLLGQSALKGGQQVLAEARADQVRELLEGGLEPPHGEARQEVEDFLRACGREWPRPSLEGPAELLGPAEVGACDWYDQASYLEREAAQLSVAGKSEEALRALREAQAMRADDRQVWNNELEQIRLHLQRDRLEEAWEQSEILFCRIPPEEELHRRRVGVVQSLIRSQQGLPYQEGLKAAAQVELEALGSEGASLALLEALLALETDDEPKARQRLSWMATYTGELLPYEQSLLHYLDGHFEQDPRSSLRAWEEAERLASQRPQAPPYLRDLRWKLVEAADRLHCLSRLEPILLRLRESPGNAQERLRLTELLMSAATSPQQVVDYVRPLWDSLDAGQASAARVLEMAAGALEKLEHFAEAAQAFQRLLATTSEDSQAARAWMPAAARCLLAAGQDRAALELEHRWLVLHGQPPGGGAPEALQRALALQAQGRWELAIFHLEGQPLSPDVRLLLAELHLQLGRPERSRQLLAEVQAESRAHQLEQARLNLEVALALSDLAACEPPLQSLGELGELGQASLGQARLQLARGQAQAGQEECLRLLPELSKEPSPLLVICYQTLARACQAQGSPARARDWLQKALECQPQDWTCLAQLSRQRIEEGLDTEAEPLLRQLLESQSAGLGPLHSLTLETRFELAQLLQRQGQSEQARGLFTQVYRALRHGSSPLLCLCQAQLARLELDSARWAQAEQHLERALQLSPPAELRSGLWLDLARALASQGRLEEGEQRLRRALRESRSHQLEVGLADFLLWHGRLEEAEAALTLLEGPAARATLARLRLQAGREQDAEPLADEVELADPEGLTTAVLRAELAEGFAFHRQSEELYTQATALPAKGQPYERLRAIYGLGRVQLAQGEVAGALRSLQRARFLLEKEPCWMRSCVLLSLGQAHRRLGQKMSAEGCLQDALEAATRQWGKKNPRLVPFLRALAELQLDQGREEAAAEVLRRACDLPADPEDGQYRQAVTLLARLSRQQQRPEEAQKAVEKLTPARPRPIATRTVPAAQAPRFRSVPTRQLVVFGRQFHTLLNAGVPLTRALASCQQAGSPLTPVLEEVEKQVLAGHSLSASVARHQNVFGRELVNMCQVGEQSGKLLAVLERWADDLEAREQRRMALVSALFYPVLVVLACVLAIVVLTTVFVPLIRSTMLTNHVPIPGLTRLLLVLSDAVRSPWLWLSLGALGWGLTRPGMRAHWGRLQRWLLKFPALGRIYRLYLFSGYFHALATLLESGIRIDVAVEMAGASIQNSEVRAQLAACRQSLLDGDELGQAIEAIHSAPPFAFQFVAVGMDTGRLPYMCRIVSRSLDMDFELAAQTLKTLLEPALLLAAGLATAFVVMAAMAPTLSMINSLG